MDPLSEIRESIRNMSSGNGSAGIFTAKVLSTDGESCCVEIDGLVVSDVQLRAVVNGEESGILITPKTDPDSGGGIQRGGENLHRRGDGHCDQRGRIWRSDQD